jgi:hypothetical protein
MKKLASTLFHQVQVPRTDRKTGTRSVELLENSQSLLRSP